MPHLRGHMLYGRFRRTQYVERGREGGRGSRHATFGDDKWLHERYITYLDYEI